MKHVKFADKSLLLGDDAADTLIAYGVLLARNASADSVTLRAFGADGEDVEATFLLDAGTILMSETTHSTVPEPDNDDAVEQMRQKMAHLAFPPPVKPSDDGMPSAYDDLDFDRT